MTRAVLIAVALVGLVLSELTWEERRLERELEEEVGAHDRYVDFGVVLKTVAMDHDLALALEREDHTAADRIRATRSHGEQVLDGLPPVFVLGEKRYGGIVDTKADPPRMIGESQSPVIWYCSADQRPLITHRPGHGDASRLLVYGSEGAGKTTAQVEWHFLSGVLRHLGEGREGGQTGPTEARLETFRQEAYKLWHPSWYRYVASEDLYVFVDGSRIRLVSTHQQTKEQGSRVQSHTWSWCGSDEIQDHTRFDGDIESRGRGAKLGRYPRLATATAKDHSNWRGWRDKVIAGGKWERHTLLGLRSPFVWPNFWEEKKITLDPREYKRRVLAEDVPAELAVFFCWERDRNLVAMPQIATDVTPAVLAGYRSYTDPGKRFSILVGHDPGNIFNTSVVLKLLMFGDLPTWTVVGELQTKQTTAAEHARQLREYLQSAFGVELGEHKAAIFVDPHGKGETKTDYQTVYGALQREKLDAFNPAPMSHVVQRAARVAMTNRLLYSAAGGVRLVVACDQYRQPAARQLVDAFESLEKKAGDDIAEGTRRKDETDKTHAPAACGFALWPFEQESITAETVKLAKREARRHG